MTTKVFKGSLWTLLGQILPLFATLLTTPITIRLLGSEGYGVLILVGIIPLFFSFADLGMGVASTKFGSAAYAEGDYSRESRVVWTAATICVLTSLFFAVPIFIFAGYIIEALNVPSHFHFEGATALRIATIAFAISLLGNVFNTPQLSRLRMDLNSAVGGGSRVLMAFATPAVLYFNGGIVGATLVGLFISVLALIAHMVISWRLLQELFPASLDSRLIRPVLKFGGGVFLSGIAVALLINAEKLFLPRLVSVEALAFYSVAFTFASMTTMFGIAMVQSLIPAFSQLTSPEKHVEFNALFSRALRLNLIWLPPALMMLFVIARPFFSIWAGEEFGQESTLPFYILLVGLLFNLVAYVPHSAITAFGRSDIFAKLFWIELVVFVGLIYILVDLFGIMGAAASWSLRVTIDGFVIIWLARRYAKVTFSFKRHFGNLLCGLVILSPPMFLAAFYDSLILVIAAVFVCSVLYVAGTWKYLVQPDEKIWMKLRAGNLLQRLRLN